MDLPTAPSGPPGDGCNNTNDNNNQLNSPSPSSQPPAFGEPSKQRRTLLKKQEQPPITLSNLTPITRYYIAANKVLEQFKVHCAAHEFDEAYIIGRRFALFSTVSLPQHDYYMSPKPELVALRQQNVKDSQWVTTGVERIVSLMDRQELEKQKQQKIKEEQQQLEWEESMRQRLDAVESKLDAKEEALEAASKKKNDGIELDMVSKLEQLNAFYAKDENDNTTTTPSAPTLYEDNDSLPPPIVPPLIGELPLPPPIVPPLIGQSTQDLKSNGATPLFEQPPAYSDIFLESLRTSTPSSVSPEELAELERLPSTSSVVASAPKKKQSKPKPTQRISIRVLIRNYERQMQSLQQSKQIEVLKLGTYQGRLSSSNPKYDSTNGCAVISPLVVATHIYPQHIQHNKKTLQRSTSYSKYGISNSDINEIIDKRAPPVLQTVRAKLGLNRHALIIPSDVHDFLVDEHILPQDLFVGVCGGDIMDKSHVNKLITMLVNGKEDDTKSKSTTCRHKKVGAALFFREHVISILKIPLGNGACYYDLIDSLPCHKTGGMASRTRCKDLASFEVLLSCYASSKFSESNCGFIDGNEYNEWMADFDPRTFQGFVWCEQ